MKFREVINEGIIDTLKKKLTFIKPDEKFIAIRIGSVYDLEEKGKFNFKLQKQVVALAKKNNIEVGSEFTALQSGEAGDDEVFVMIKSAGNDKENYESFKTVLDKTKIKYKEFDRK
jgi:hypothetical protein